MSTNSDIFTMCMYERIRLGNDSAPKEKERVKRGSAKRGSVNGGSVKGGDTF